MVRLSTMNAEENVDAKTESWSNVVAFEKNSQTCPTQNAFVTSRLLKQLRPTQLTRLNTTAFWRYIKQSFSTMGSTILTFSYPGIVGSYYNTKTFFSKSIAVSQFLIGIGVWLVVTLSQVLFGTRATTVLVVTEFQVEVVYKLVHSDRRCGHYQLAPGEDAWGEVFPAQPQTQLQFKTWYHPIPIHQTSSISNKCYDSNSTISFTALSTVQCAQQIRRLLPSSSFIMASLIRSGGTGKNRATRTSSTHISSRKQRKCHPHHIVPKTFLIWIINLVACVPSMWTQETVPLDVLKVCH